jgi:membrane fusion protein, multidrug efflux system
MNPFAFAYRRPITTLLLVLGLASGGILAAEEMGVIVVPAPYKARIGTWLHSVRSTALVSIRIAKAAEPEKQSDHEHQTIVVTSPKVMDVTITQPYVCQIRARRFIEVRALESGYLGDILVKEGQAVKKGDLMFKVVPILYQARLDAEMAEAQLAELKYNNTRQLAAKNVVSENEVKLLQAELAKAQAKVKLAKAELDFTYVVAPFDGIVDRLQEQLGSLVSEGDVLTTLSDNSVMWVYFNVPEAQYFEYMADVDQHKDEKIELVLADGSKFPETGKIGAIEAKFNNETGNIPFRADFPNPKRLLRHGQTGTVLIHRALKDAIVIPQRATFELLDKQYVYVVGEDRVAHQRLITVQHELEDTFVIASGLGAKDRIVLEGIREVHDGDKVEYEFRDPEVVLTNQKYRAE